MTSGRLPKYTSNEEVEQIINNYYADCENRDAPLTMSGLAEALDLSRQSLVNYSKNELFFDTILKAKRKVEKDQAERLVGGKGNATGIIFSLKNNYGWVDKQEIEQTNIDKTPFEIKIVK